jgi:hypothetical protein
MKFNLNDVVRVKLTFAGHAALREYHQTLWKGRHNAPAYVPPVEDAEGYSLFQVWALMNALGHMLQPGGTLPFNVNLEVVPHRPAPQPAMPVLVA